MAKLNKVTVSDGKKLSFFLDSGVSAVGLLGSVASQINNGDKVVPPYIISKDGKIRPLLQRYVTKNSEYEPIIDSMLLYDVEQAELAYNKVCSEMSWTYMPAYQKAFDAIRRWKVAHMKNGSEYVTYTFHRDCVSIEHSKSKPKNMRNQHIARMFDKAEDDLTEWFGRLRTHEDILMHAIQHNLPPRLKNRAENQTVRDTCVYSLLINGRRYMFTMGKYGQLSKLAFPDAQNADPLVEMSLPNNKKQWPFNWNHEKW